MPRPSARTDRCPADERQQASPAEDRLPSIQDIRDRTYVLVSATAWPGPGPRTTSRATSSWSAVRSTTPRTPRPAPACSPPGSGRTGSRRRRSRRPELSCAACTLAVSGPGPAGRVPVACPPRPPRCPGPPVAYRVLAHVLDVVGGDGRHHGRVHLIHGSPPRWLGRGCGPTRFRFVVRPPVAHRADALAMRQQPPAALSHSAAATIAAVAAGAGEAQAFSARHQGRGGLSWD